MPFVSDFSLIVIFALYGMVALVAGGKCLRNKDGATGVMFILVGSICIALALVNSYDKLGAGNPAKFNLNMGVVYCTEWSGGRNGAGKHEYVIRNASENRNYFVKSGKEQLPAGCFLQTESGELIEVPSPKLTAPSK